LKSVRAGRAGNLVAAFLCIAVLSAGCTARCIAPAEEGGCPETSSAKEAGLSVGAPPADPADGAVIIDDPIVFDDERRSLTLDYIRAHYDPAAATIQIVPHMIVLHWTANCTSEGTWRMFNRVRMDPGNGYLAKNGAVNVSAHFLVNSDGTIRRLLPETIMARHVIGLNWCAIGVENVGTDVGCTLTDAQVEADAALVRYLVAKYPTITYLIGHHESESFRGTPLFTELVSGYATPKIDPGASFMARVRERVKDLGLACRYGAEGCVYTRETTDIGIIGEGEGRPGR
jgi:N-acetylmuramoyl-L-alanine amidase